MNEKINLDCDQVIKLMKEVIYSIMEPVSKSCYEAHEPYSDSTKVTMLWDDADFILDELGFLINCLIILEKRASRVKEGV